MVIYMKRYMFINLLFIILLCGCESSTNNKLETCCRYNGGFIEDDKCIDYYSEYELNTCLDEDDNLMYGASTEEGQQRRMCCIDNGGRVSSNGKECSIDNDDKPYLDNCLNNIR